MSMKFRDHTAAELENHIVELEQNILNINLNAQSSYDRLTEENTSLKELLEDACQSVNYTKRLLDEKIEQLASLNSQFKEERADRLRLQERIIETETQLALMKKAVDTCGDMLVEKEKQLLGEVSELQDRLKSGIRYDEELNVYVLCWTEREIKQAEKEADKIMKVLGNLPQVDEVR